MKIFIQLVAFALIFIGCSNKQYFEPEQVDDSYYTQANDMPSSIKSLNKDGATLEDYKTIDKGGISKYFLPSGYSFLNKINSTMIASNKSGNVLINDKENIFNFKNNVIAASIKNDLLALIFSDNSIGLYDMTTKKFKFREYKKNSLTNDERIANPIFEDEIVLFPTLNGNIIIVNTKSFKAVKTITIDPNNRINNVIFLKVKDDTMIAATSNKILTLGDGSFSVKDYSIKDIILKDNHIYIATLDGNIIKLNLLFEKIATKKFKFAKIHSLGFGTKLYALESQGYLIELNDDFSDVKIYDFDFDEDTKVISINDALYFDNMYIKLK